MSMDIPSILDTNYVGSKGKLLFRRVLWILILLIVFSLVVGRLDSLVLKRMGLGSNPTAVFIFAGIQTVFHVAAWLLILLPYGRNNRIQAFKIMFFIVGGAECIGAFSSFISAYSKSYTLYTQELFSPVIHTVSDVTGILPVAAWIAFMVVVLYHPKTNRSLKKASILMLISSTFVLSCSYLSTPLFQPLSQNLENAMLGRLISSLTVMLVVFAFASQIYFLWAMARSEMKEGATDNIMEKTI